MGEEAPAMEGAKPATAGEKPTAPPHLRDEGFLKFAGAATTILGLVLLIASVIAMGVLSILKAQLDPWVPLLPLSLLLVLVGVLLTIYFRKVIERAVNPKKPEPVRPPYGFVYPYAMAPQYYGARIPSPPMAPPPSGLPGSPMTAPTPPAPIPIPQVSMPPAPAPAARPSSRFCIICGRRIPLEAKFCPYCRHAYTA